MWESTDGPRSSEVGKEMRGRVRGWNEGQRGRAGVCQKRFSRDGRISAWELQPTSHSMVMLIQVASREETGALMVAPFGVGEGSGCRATGRGRSADTSGQPEGVHTRGHRDRSPVQGALATDWGLDAPGRTEVGVEGGGGPDSRARSTGPCGNPPAARVAESGE